MMRLMAAAVLVFGVGCSSGAGVPASTTVGPETYGADAEESTPVTTPDGETVYLWDSSVYGPCELLEPHKGDLAGWLEVEPPEGFADFGFVCT